jgi:hypothetical protein
VYEGGSFRHTPHTSVPDGDGSSLPQTWQHGSDSNSLFLKQFKHIPGNPKFTGFPQVLQDPRGKTTLTSFFAAVLMIEAGLN